MDNYDVSVISCEDYSDENVETALKSSLEQINGLDFVKSGMVIGIKANLVTAMKPDLAATVHPSVICALVKILRERGAEVIIGDSPGGIYSAPYLKVVYDVSGMRRAETFGAKLNDDFSQSEIDYPQAVKAKHFPYTSWLSKVDAIIDVCKLKTHAMMGLSCAVKNFFGTIPGTKKPEFHYRFPKAEDFADMLVDVYEYSKPALCICDAVIGMEGNGPTQGTPRKIGCLVASKNGHMLDTIAADIIGIKASEVPTIKAAQNRGLLTEDSSQIRVFGDLSKFRIPDFKTVEAQSSVFFKVLGDGFFGKVADFFASRVITPFPKLEPKSCVGCKKCAQICPAKAITMKNGKPHINRKICIHCFCCQEFCPMGAMRYGRHLIMRVLGR